MPDATFISKSCKGFIYVAELARKGSRHIRWSRMPEGVSEPDVIVDPRRVPLAVRREGRRALLCP